MLDRGAPRHCTMGLQGVTVPVLSDLAGCGIIVPVQSRFRIRIRDRIRIKALLRSESLAYLHKEIAVRRLLYTVEEVVHSFADNTRILKQKNFNRQCTDSRYRTLRYSRIRTVQVWPCARETTLSFDYNTERRTGASYVVVRTRKQTLNPYFCFQIKLEILSVDTRHYMPLGSATKSKCINLSSCEYQPLSAIFKVS
jgi:hypothetical protein